jgi:hypothetical protein
VGQTGRAFRTRAEEHKRCYRNRSLDQAHFAKHFWETGHSSDFIPEIIHRCRKGKKMDVLEELEMKRNLCGGQVLNDILFQKHSPLLSTVTTTTVTSTRRSKITPRTTCVE